MKLLILFVTIFCTLSDLNGENVVSTDTGRIRGKTIKVLNNDLHVYLGIPYAVPPIGELRFRESIAVSPWDDIYNATVMTPICMQDPIFPLFEWVPRERRYMSEDCLYLNIWVPVKNTNGKPFSTMVWIHGGALNTGSSNMVPHYGRILASVGNVIVASISYRLGAFGFLSLDNDQVPGNMGLMDQVMAMKWIHRNIENFGGDRNEITIFGSSAGSISVTHHLLSPLTKGLFKRAIPQSGSNYVPYFLVDKEINQKTSELIAVNAGCGNTEGTCGNNDVLACLRNIDAMEISAAEKLLMQQKETLISLKPQKGGKYMPENPIHHIDNNLMHDVEVMIGQVSDEGSTLLAMYKPESLNQENPVLTKSAAANILSKFYNITGSLLSRVVEVYLGHLPEDAHSEIFERTKQATGEGILTCAIVALAEKLSENHRTVYYYNFNHARIKAGYKKWEGVSHFAEVYFAFGIPFIFPENYTPEEEDLSVKTMQLWSSFAKTGKPSFVNQEDEWLPFDTKNRQGMDIKLGNIRSYKEEVKKECEMWKEIYRQV